MSRPSHTHVTGAGPAPSRRASCRVAPRRFSWLIVSRRLVVCVMVCVVLVIQVIQQPHFFVRPPAPHHQPHLTRSTPSTQPTSHHRLNPPHHRRGRHAQHEHPDRGLCVHRASARVYLVLVRVEGLCIRPRHRHGGF
ncbi:hypothetical protein B0H12DRAFT_1123771 [Mycena haematopus]|nr:hypothetical protein B0H12DRAFT_1123771 [Mycena haematopus]